MFCFSLNNESFFEALDVGNGSSIKLDLIACSRLFFNFGNFAEWSLIHPAPRAARAEEAQT